MLAGAGYAVLFISQRGCSGYADEFSTKILGDWGHLDYEDLMYVFSLGHEVPRYREGLVDSAPCQFIGVTGCTLPRSLRPFRCNWFFCVPLVKHMQGGPGRPYRAFVSDFEDLLAWRNEMIREFYRVLESLTSRRTRSPSGKAP
jgi:hypothetical protein